MDRINGADFVDIGGGRRGFRSQNLGDGVIGTEVTAAWLNAVQENLMKVIEEAGLEGDIDNWDLLWLALLRSSTRVSQSIITSSGTYTPRAGILMAGLELVGGGGGGGGSFGAASPNVSPGTGGGGAGYARRFYTAEELGASAAVVIGAAGTGGLGQNSGSSGGTSTFTPAGAGGALTATGGAGGFYGLTYTTLTRGESIAPGGTGSGGQVNLRGTSSGWPLAFGGSAYTAISGRGGDSRLGNGGQESQENNNGNVGSGYGAGGGGAASLTVSKTGANGTPGACFVTEYWRDE